MPKSLFFTNYNRGPISSLDCARGFACFADRDAYFTGVNCPGSPMQPLMSSDDWTSLKEVVAKKFGDFNPTGKLCGRKFCGRSFVVPYLSSVCPRQPFPSVRDHDASPHAVNPTVDEVLMLTSRLKSLQRPSANRRIAPVSHRDDP